MTGYFKELASAKIYKGAQGRVARRLTLIGLVLVFLLGAYSMFSSAALGSKASPIAAVVIAVVGLWVSFRTINYPTFADFLVSVEAEMTKVSWPSKKELMANTKVVLIFMVLFTVLIFLYDIVFRVVFSVFN